MIVFEASLLRRLTLFLPIITNRARTFHRLNTRPAQIAAAAGKPTSSRLS
jgi:hypothetical protein